MKSFLSSRKSPPRPFPVPKKSLLASFLFPPICPVCLESIRDQKYSDILCHRCLETLQKYSMRIVIPADLDLAKSFRQIYSVYPYSEKVVNKLIYLIKFRFYRSWAQYFIPSFIPIQIQEKDVIVPVPTDIFRFFQRGFSLSYDFAKRLFPHHQHQIYSLFAKRVFESQHLKDAKSRHQIRERTFEWRKKSRGKRVEDILSQARRLILVDDIMTSGNTLYALAQKVQEKNPQLPIVACSISYSPKYLK